MFRAPSFLFVSLKFLTVSQNVVTVEFRSLPFFARIFLASTNEDSTQALYGMSLWWKENYCSESWIEPCCWKSEGAREGVSREDEEMFRRLTLPELARRTVPKERNSWHTPTGSCESDETEDEGTAPFWAPPGLPDPLIEERRIREVVGCQTDVTAKAENRLQPRYKQIKDAMRFEVIITDKKQQRAGWPETPLDFKLERGIEERRSYKQHGRTSPRDHGPRGGDANKHICQGAGQLILYNKSTFEPEGVKIHEEIQGTSM